MVGTHPRFDWYTAPSHTHESDLYRSFKFIKINNLEKIEKIKFLKMLFSNQNLVQYPSDPSEAETALEAHKSLVAEVNDMKPRVSSYWSIQIRALIGSRTKPIRVRI